MYKYCINCIYWKGLASVTVLVPMQHWVWQESDRWFSGHSWYQDHQCTFCLVASQSILINSFQTFECAQHYNSKSINSCSSWWLSRLNLGKACTQHKWNPTDKLKAFIYSDNCSNIINRSESSDAIHPLLQIWAHTHI